VTSAYQATPGTGESSPNGDQESNVREGRRAPFKQLPDAVMDDDTISFTGKAVYWYLMRIASSDHRGRVSISTLATKGGLSRWSARGCLKELVKAGWLEIADQSLDARVDLALDFVIHAEAVANIDDRSLAVDRPC